MWSSTSAHTHTPVALRLSSSAAAAAALLSVIKPADAYATTTIIEYVCMYVLLVEWLCHAFIRAVMIPYTRCFGSDLPRIMFALVAISLVCVLLFILVRQWRRRSIIVQVVLFCVHVLEPGGGALLVKCACVYTVSCCPVGNDCLGLHDESSSLSPSSRRRPLLRVRACHCRCRCHCHCQVGNHRLGSAGRERRDSECGCGQRQQQHRAARVGGRSVQRPSRRNECRGRRGRLLFFGLVRCAEGERWGPKRREGRRSTGEACIIAFACDGTEGGRAADPARPPARLGNVGIIACDGSSLARAPSSDIGDVAFSVHATAAP